MPEITEIRRGPRGSQRRRIFIDGEEWRSVPADVLKDAGVREGSRVELATLEDAVDSALPSAAWERALRLLNFRERGSGELGHRLAEDGYPPDVVAATVGRARELGFLDDARFADGLVRGLADGRGLGKRRIAAELSHKGVSDELAADLLGSYCDEAQERERAEALAARLVRSRPLSPGKLASRLVSKGFTPSLAIDVAQRYGDAWEQGERSSSHDG